MSDAPGGSPGPPLLWDQHCCLPLSARADVGTLARYLRPGGSYVSVNVGYVPHSSSDVLALLGMFRRRIAADERYLLAASVREIEQAHRSDRVAVGFDLEDCGPLDGQLDRIRQSNGGRDRTTVVCFIRPPAPGRRRSDPHPRCPGSPSRPL